MRSRLARVRNYLHPRLIGLVRHYYNYFWGTHLSEGVRIALSAKLDKTNPEGIFIGPYSAVAFGATILSHDIATLKTTTTKIGSYCLIGARSLIMPGITIGDHVIIGAGAVVMTNIPSNCVALGNPARVIERGIDTVEFGIRREAYEARLREEQSGKVAKTGEGESTVI